MVLLFLVVRGFYLWLFQKTWEKLETRLTKEFCTVAQHSTQKALFIVGQILSKSNMAASTRRMTAEEI